MNKVVEKAKAKINLFLEITGKLPSGYHEIESIMYAADLCDTVSVEITDKNITELACNFEKEEHYATLEALEPENNIAYKAAELFFKNLGKRDGIRITIDKKIPVCAGLGGGSTDAAAVLRALNTLYEKPFTTERLCEMGKLLGADVPFCVVGGVCLCHGIGEKLTPLETDLALHGIIVMEKAKKQSTAAAYAMADNRSSDRIISAAGAVAALKENDYFALCENLYNVFEGACDYGSTAKSIMNESGADGILLSGAGPSFFALVKNDEKRDNMKKALENSGYRVYNY